MLVREREKKKKNQKCYGEARSKWEVQEKVGLSETRRHSKMHLRISG